MGRPASPVLTPHRRDASCSSTSIASKRTSGHAAAHVLRPATSLFSAPPHLPHGIGADGEKDGFLFAKRIKRGWRSHHILKMGGTILWKLRLWAHLARATSR